MIAVSPRPFGGPSSRQPAIFVSGLLTTLTIFSIAACSMIYAAYWTSTAAPTAPARAYDVYFAPGGNPTDAVVRAITGARRTIRVQAYSFTSAPIAKALVDARKRGVDVTALLDRSNRTAQYSSADFLAHEQVPTYIDAKHAIAHNKIIIIDGETVLTGSFNFTKAAEESNAENLLVIRDQLLATQYEQNWELHRQHSELYPGR